MINENNGIEESKQKQSRRQGESTPEMSIGHAYAVEPLAVGKVLRKILLGKRKHSDCHYSN